MNNVFLTIIREIGILLIILVILSAVMVLAFKDQLPYDDIVPSGEQYTQVNKNSYTVTSTDRISEIDAVTVVHEANQSQIISAENDVRITTGKYTPFGTIDSTTDLPSEKVGVSTTTVTKSGDSAKDNTNDDSKESSSDVDDLVKDVEEAQSQDSESVAKKRMGNEK